MQSVVLNILTYAVVFFGISLFCIFTETARAQGMPSVGDGVSIGITSSPLFPTPYSDIQLSLDDYGINTIGSSIRWYVDGKELTNMQNERSITIRSGALGEDTVVRAQLQGGNTPSISTSFTVTPIEVDIILESKTYTPNFYKGRALPSPESSVRAVALIHTGKNTARESYSYRWRFGETVLFGGPVKGRYAVDITVPRLNGGRLTVEVYDTNGTVVGRESVIVGSVTPTLLLYEYSPLRGLIQKTSPNTLLISDRNTLVYAEPYFLNTQNIANDATFIWKLNGREIQNINAVANTFSPSTVSIGRNTKLEVSVLTKARIPQYASNSVVVSLE